MVDVSLADSYVVPARTNGATMNQPKRAAIYLRVSREDQTTENQRIELEHLAAARGWTIVHTYRDHGISGAKGRDRRPGLDAMLKDATRRRFDVVMAWAVDRLGRSLTDLLDTMNTLNAAGVDLLLHEQALDTTAPHGRLLFQITGAFAEFEREMIRARVNAGIRRAQKHGTRSGRAIGRPKIDPKVEERIRKALGKGTGVLKTARELGVGTSVVQRIRDEDRRAA